MLVILKLRAELLRNLKLSMSAQPSRHVLELIEKNPDLRAKLNPLKTMLATLESRNAEIMEEKERKVLDLQYQIAQKDELSQKEIHRLQSNLKELENKLSTSKKEEEDLKKKLGLERRSGRQSTDSLQKLERETILLRRSKKILERDFSTLNRKWQEVVSDMTTTAESWEDEGTLSREETPSDGFIEEDEESDSDEEFVMPGKRRVCPR